MKRLYIIGILLLLLLGGLPEVQGTLLQWAHDDRVNVAQTFITGKTRTAILAIKKTLPTQKAIIKTESGSTIIETTNNETIDLTDDFSLEHGQSLTAEQINTILGEMNSPAEGTGNVWIEAGQRTNIDAAYMLAIFIHESTAGTNQNWAGITPNGTTHNIGNMICTPNTNRWWSGDCYNRFRNYSSWENGINDNFDNLAYYRDNRGVKTIVEAISIWAPPTENNTNAYIAYVEEIVSSWRTLNTSNTVASGNEVTSSPISLEGDFGTNVKIALNANNGALRRVNVLPGQQFSFNETVGNPADITENIINYAGVDGGGWCDLAGRYVQTARQILPEGSIEMLSHGVTLNGLTYTDSPLIWNIDGTAGNYGGRQDIVITNNTKQTLVFYVTEENNTAIIHAVLD